MQQLDRSVRSGRADGLQRRQPGDSVRNEQRQWHQIQQTGLVLFNKMVQSDTTESSSMMGTSMCSSTRPSERAADRRRPRQHARARRGDARHVASALAQAGPRNARVHAVSHAPRAGTRRHSTRHCLSSPLREARVSRWHDPASPPDERQGRAAPALTRLGGVPEPTWPETVENQSKIIRNMLKHLTNN